MKLSEILEDADLLVPNAFNQEQKLRMLNQTQRQLYRDYPQDSEMFTFNLTPGTDTYFLPSDCKVEQITDFYVNGREYLFTNPSEIGNTNTYRIENGRMVIVPVPSEALQAKLYYKPSPNDLTLNDMDEVPTFPEDYHELLVLGVAYRLAERGQDFKTGGELMARYNNLARLAESKMTKPKPRKVRQIRSWN